MEIKADKFRVHYDDTKATLTCEGKLFLNGSQEYEPILQLFKQAVAQELQGQKNLTIDLRQLNILNSSGITMMTRFVMYVFEEEGFDIDITFLGQKKVNWHQKLLENMTLLQPTLKIQLE